VNRKRTDPLALVERQNYSLPLPPVLITGSLLAAVFYGLILAGPLNIEILRRYCLSHPVAIAAVCLFYVGMVGMVWKWMRAQRQNGLVKRSSAALKRLVQDGTEIGANKRVDWLFASWQSEPEGTRSSWLGQRVLQALLLLQSRGRRQQVESDLKNMADQAADQQYESYSLLRIIHWAMPMLGFLGTVLGISQTLGRLDTQLLATQQQDAMNQLTSGLYVAFDTTAIALTLTVTSMFIQFAVGRIELNLLERINRETESALVPFLSLDPFDTQDTLITPIRDMAAELIAGVERLVSEQALIWSRSMEASQSRWSEWTDRLSGEAELQSAHALSSVLANHLVGLESLHEKNAVQLEGRIQQWQTTLSDQTRALHSHQKEIVQQTASIQNLVNSIVDLKKLESTLTENLDTVKEVQQLHHASERIEQASQCIGEAVAVLATSMERAGLLRSPPQRPRHASRLGLIKENEPLCDSSTEAIERKEAEPDTTESTQKRRGKAA
jgi:biopolymer transport protein ExbB/TolQ